MGYQELKGVKVTPLGAGNRLLNSPLFNATSKAFGGWVYNASVEIGFSQQPTSITLDITLDAQDGKYKTNASDFDITKEDLKVSATGGTAGESYYEIKFGDKVYKPMFLSSFEIAGSADSKTLKVKFLDYSIQLDKIYIALYKKQAYDYNQNVSFSARPNITALCPGCVLDDSTFYEVEVNPTASENEENPANLVSLKLDAAAYFYNYKNRFQPFNIYEDISPPIAFELYKTYYARTFKDKLNFFPWNSVSKTPTNQPMLDINGGTVVLGVEEFNQTMCGSAAEVSYNFTELISILAKSGLNFSKLDSLDHLASSGDIIGIDKNPNYRKNYNGTLREVLGNWCADFALDFYVDGTRIHFVNLCTSNASQLEQDIEKITKVTNPSTTEGMGLNSDKDYAIASFTESADIADTYEQTLITLKVKPRRSEEKSKEKKNHCGFLAVHPLDILNLNLVEQADYPNMYGKIIKRPHFLNKIWESGKKHWYTNRSFDCIDKCSAIGKYSSIYRNIYAGGLISDNSRVLSREDEEEEEEEEEEDEGVTAQTVGPKVTSSQMDGFNSFGFIPLYKVQPACQPDEDSEDSEDTTGCGDEQARLDLIEKVFKSSGSQQRYIVNHNTFDIWIGFRNEEESQELVEWERKIAENMYKYGILVKGPSAYPEDPEKDSAFVPEDFATQANKASEGIDYGSLKLLKVSSSSTPPFERYRFFEDLAFKDLFKTHEEFLSSKVRTLPFASLDNDWGTSQEVFDESLRVTNHSSASCNNYGQAKLLDDPNNPSASDPDGNDTPPDSFSVADFQPKFEDLPDDIFEDESFSDLKAILKNSKATKGLLGKLIQSQKQKTTASGNLSYSQAQCPRLQLMIIPRVKNGLINLNPHLKVTFDFNKGENAIQQKNFFKKIYLESREKAKDFLKSKCEYSLEDIVCDFGKAKIDKECDSYTGAVAEDCVCLPSINDPRADPSILQAYQIGFINSRPTALSPTDAICPAREIIITIDVHHDVNRYNEKLSGENVIKPLAGGGVGYLAEDEDYPVFIPAKKKAGIVYPRQSDDLDGRGVNSPKEQNSLYQGILSQTATFQTRNSESVECHGSQWCGDTNVSKIQVINNEVAQEIDQLVNPQTKGFYSPVYDMQGNAVKTIADYHRLMSVLSEPDKTSHILPARTMNFEIVGNALEVDSLLEYLHPHRGLKSLSFTLSPEGFRSNLSFTNRSLKLPKPEAIMNKIRSVF